MAKAKDNNEAESDWCDEPLSVTIYDINLVDHYAVVIGEWDYPGIVDDIPESNYNALQISARPVSYTHLRAHET